MKGYCAPVTEEVMWGFVCEGSEEGEYGHVLAVGCLHATAMSQRFLSQPYAAVVVAAVFYAKGKDREAAGIWTLWNLTVGT